jgi:hypothetical protein
VLCPGTGGGGCHELLSMVCGGREASCGVLAVGVWVGVTVVVMGWGSVT